MSAKRQKKQMSPTELVLLESGEGSVPGPGGCPGPSDWLKAKHSPAVNARHGWRKGPTQHAPRRRVSEPRRNPLG